MKQSFFSQLWHRGPLSWAIIRNEECKLLSKRILNPPILEIGCGDGFVTQLAFGKRLKIDVGIDLDPKEISRAQKTNIYKRLEQVDILHNHYPNSSFNTVFANSVLEHIKDLDTTLSEIYRLLKKGGQFINASPITTYTELLFYYRVFSFLKLGYLAKLYGKLINDVFFHRHLLTPQEWRKKLEKVGFRVEILTTYLSPHAIALHDFFLPPAIYTRVLKKYTGKMVFLESFRNHFFPSLAPSIEKYLNRKSKTQKRANIFFVVSKI